jgi:hypothetical protein
MDQLPQRDKERSSFRYDLALSTSTIITEWKGIGKKKGMACVSLAIMSPLTAKVKCPHDGRQTNLESEAVKAVASSQDGA